MTAPDEQNRHVPTAPTSVVARYLFALVAITAGVLITLAIFESDVSEQPIYAPLIGGVTLAVWYGGFGPGVLAIAIGWTCALWLFVAPRGELMFGDTEDMARWWINLAMVVVIAGASGLLRARQEGTARELVSTRASMDEVESLQELSVALAAAVSPDDVASVLTSHAGRIVGAQGVALCLVEGDELVVVDPSGLATDAHFPGRRLALEARTPITEAAREGRLARAATREVIDTSYTDSRDMLPPSVRSAFAIPLRTGGGDVVGSIGFLFDREGGPTSETEGLARIVADLAGQTLERARLYESEHESRQALDRILQVAPRFLVDDAGSVLVSVCREARVTFGADYGLIWRVNADALELLCIDPPRPELQTELQLPLDDFPQLRDAIRGLRTSFVPDVLESSRGDGLEFVRRLGMRSSLRAPVVIAGETELVVSMSWQVVVSEPDSATLAVVRRFADQAGLALEQLERRRAEAEVRTRADATRRLQVVTAALSQAATPVDVSNTCLEHALLAIGAQAGFVVLTDQHGTRTVELVASTGYDDGQLDAWRAFGLDADLPFARAVASGEPVWALTAQELAAFPDRSVEPGASGWIAIPLLTSRGVRGALHISLRSPTTITPNEREWLQAMVSQCGQALERSGLYDEEQRSRLRAERLQAMTAQLSNALTPSDVAQVVVDEVTAAFGPSAAALAAVESGDVSGVLAALVAEDGILATLTDVDAGTPGGKAVLTRRSVLIDDLGTMRAEFPVAADAIASTGHNMYLAIPLVAARRVNGLLVAAWERPHRLVAEDVAIVEALAGQAAQALDRAGRYESEQSIAETLQRSVLPGSLPRVDGVHLAARYLPGSAGVDVGGDWFDALQLQDGTLLLVVGDVVGKGVQAAASMAQLRNAIRALSVDQLKPSSALTRLNRISGDVLDAPFATVVYVTIDPTTGVCRMSSAGHLPPLVAFADGRVELLESVRGLPLGAEPQAKYRQDTVALPAGSVLVLYTDGLVERRDRSIDDGLATLRAAVAAGPKDPDRLLDHVLEQVMGDREREDDIAMLAARVFPVAPQPLDVRVRPDIDAMRLVRDSLRAWLAGTTLDRSEAEGLVLATWEAVANAIEHAVEPSDQTVRVHARAEDSFVRIVIEDTGGWAPPSGRGDRGFGLLLMESFVSSFDIATGDAGTTITLEKALETEDRSTR